jgi:hypothetical protein
VPEPIAQSELRKTVDKITGYRERTRKLVIGIAVVAVAAVLVAAGCGYLFLRLHDSQVNNCVAGNMTRAQQGQLWVTFIDVVAGSHPTLVVRRAEDLILRDVAATYAPVDCSDRYPLW